ncbi:MAG: glycerol kinase GlpK [Oscillospiraceae bacterium]|jgi:glycerol kinase|nr:glycerol kinase GlpK [Oscillospiraceae bacterium]
MSATKKYVLALDQGTTSSRAILFDRQGNIVAKAQKEYDQCYPQAGWVEHDPMEILYSQMNALELVLSEIEGRVSVRDIAAIGITNQRETTILWDKSTGRPVYNAIVWQCRRTAGLCEELKANGCADLVKSKTGLVIDAYFSGTKIKWILDNVPAARELANQGRLCFGTVETWLIWNFTGGKSHVTDYSNASRTMLFDVDRLCWDQALCDLLTIPMDILPKPVPSGAFHGEVAPGLIGLHELAGIPITGAIGDQPAALFGQACFLPGQAKNTYGTGCFLLMNTGKKRACSERNLLTGIAWGLGDEVEYAIEGSAFNAGSVIQWMRDELKLIDSAARCDELAASVSDANGVYLVPAFTGLGAPYWDMYARGILVGLTRGVNRTHIARAVIECIPYQLCDLLEAMSADAGLRLSEIRVDGGASVSNIMMQIQADLSQTQVNRPKVVESTALGAAYMAGLVAGVWQNKEEITLNRQVDRVFVPKMPRTQRDKLYRGWRRAVERSMNWAVEDE